MIKHFLIEPAEKEYVILGLLLGCTNPIPLKHFLWKDPSGEDEKAHVWLIFPDFGWEIDAAYSNITGDDGNELLELWPTYEVDEKKVEKLTTTNISHANMALNSILDDLEKVQLEKLFFADNGWYKIISQDGMVQLKLAAMSLGLSNNVFTFDSTEEQHMLEVVGALSREQQVLNMRCYMKQKNDCRKYRT